MHVLTDGLTDSSSSSSSSLQIILWIRYGTSAGLDQRTHPIQSKQNEHEENHPHTYSHILLFNSIKPTYAFEMQILSLALLAAVSMSAVAFAPASLMPASRTSSRAVAGATLKASDKPLTELCEITKEACEAVAPMLSGK